MFLDGERVLGVMKNLEDTHLKKELANSSFKLKFVTINIHDDIFL